MAKYALVTGASRGIGRAVALKLSSVGLPVVINYKSNRKAAEQVAEEIRLQGGTAELLPFDVADKPAVDEALDRWEHDNVMFMMADEQWHNVVNTSLDGFFYITRRLLKHMMPRKRGGRIINVASLSGVKGMPGQTNYSAAKAGLIGATKALAQEVAARGVTVNAVAPGFIETDMTRDLPQEELKKMVPAQRFGKPEEVAALVAFLASDEAAYITGEVININGGLYT